MASVAQVLEASDAPELTSRLAHSEPTLVRVGAVHEAAFGGGAVSIIGGPCAVEDEARLIEVATSVRRAGGALLRGGAFKPRTSPYSFQGLGREGLERLSRVRAQIGIPVVTEVLDPREVERVGEVADMFQIGSRSMTNFALLREVGKARKPVLLKRGFAATAREFLLAAEYILDAGNPDVVLCERGIRGFDSVTRNVLDLGTVVWLKQRDTPAGDRRSLPRRRAGGPRAPAGARRHRSGRGRLDRRGAPRSLRGSLRRRPGPACRGIRPACRRRALAASVRLDGRRATRCPPDGDGCSEEGRTSQATGR